MTGKALTGRGITRRAAVAAGLGALACAPTAALAETLTRLGYRAGGEAWDGLVTVEGKTYLYEGGVKFCGGEKEFRGSRYFWPADGHMAADEWVKLGDERQAHYAADGVMDSSVAVPESGEGWVESDGSWLYMESGAPHVGWLVTRDYPAGLTGEDPGLQRYWLDRSSGVLAVNETVEYAEGEHTRALPRGFVARGVVDDGRGRVFFADNDGRLACMDKGWHVGPDLVPEAGAQRFWMLGNGGAKTSFFEAEGSWYYGRGGVGYVLRGAMSSGGNVLVADNDGRLIENYGGPGWVVTSKITGDMRRFWLKEIDGHMWCPKGLFDADGNEHYGLDEGYVLHSGSVWDKDTRQLIVADADGNVTKKVRARPLAAASYDGVVEPAWDFEDWDFVERMRGYASAGGSETDWFFAVDVDAPVRAVVFHREDGEWVPAGGWYVATGRKYANGAYGGLPREAAGYHRLTNRWLPDTPSTPTGPGYAVDFIECYYRDDDGSIYQNDSASIHAGRARGEWGYTTHSCIAMTWSRARWCYDNLSGGAGMHISGSCGGIHDGADLEDEEVHTATLVDPFA